MLTRKTVITTIIVAAIMLNILLPILRRVFFGSDTGEIESVKTASSPKERLGTYFVPGFLGVNKDAVTPYARDIPGDVWFVKLSTKDYRPNDIAMAIAEHIREQGYTHVNLVTISMGDQITSCLNFHLPDGMVKEQRIRVYTIDTCADSRFINKPCTLALKIGTPIAQLLRCALGAIGEIPFIKHDSWNSLSEIIQQF